MKTLTIRALGATNKARASPEYKLGLKLRTESTLSTRTLPTTCSDYCGSPERNMNEYAPIPDITRKLRI